MDFEYGVADQVTGDIRRVIARNPGPFTFYGTGTYIVGRGSVAVIDPGPELPEHFDALVRAIEGERVTHILVTHTHSDHSPLSRRLAAHTGGLICGYGMAGHKPQAGEKLMSGMEEAVDRDTGLDVELSHGDSIQGDGWELEALHTPGHMANHLCFSLRGKETLFSGDHVMGWSTSVVVPPEGNMSAYMESLKFLLERPEGIYWPTHGPPIHHPKNLVEAFIEHRKDRERQIFDWLGRADGTIDAMVAEIYQSVPKELHEAAAQSVFSHLIKMAREGRVSCDGAPGRASVYSAR
jgi:glyoxylase-like metal-dependent hydrolase (beta-lactamase superfamily II)